MKIFSLIILALLLSASALNDARKANEAFQRGEYELAAQLYRQAIEQNPDDARLYFNLGNALANLGSDEEADEAFQEFRDRASTPQEQALADYNRGKMQTDREQYDEALSNFRDALRKNPDDEDARHNYELAQRRLQQQEQQQQEQQQDQDGDGEDDDDQDQDQQGEPDQQPDAGQQPESPQDPGDELQDPGSPDDMSREQAENLLDALEQLERELLENRKKESERSTPRNERDW